MNDMKLEDINERLKRFEEVHFYGPVQPEMIEEAERILALRFPPEYRQFLEKFGCGRIESEEIIGLGGPHHLDVVKLRSILSNRRNSLPANLLPLRADGGGNYDCLDARSRASNGEFRIVEWRHDAAAGANPDVVSTSFLAWFESILKMVEEAR